MLSAAIFALLTQQATPQVRTDTAVSKDTARLRPVIIRESAPPTRAYGVASTVSALKVATPLRDTPLSISVITSAFIKEHSMLSMTDALRFVPGVTMGQGEGHRDAPTFRGNASTADFFVDGMRDDAQYLRDLYNVERVEALGGANAMTFGRGGGGGVVNRVTKRAESGRVSDLRLEGGAYGHSRTSLDVGGALTNRFAARLNGLYQQSGSFRDLFVNTRIGLSPQFTLAVSPATIVRAGAEYFSDERTVDRGLPSFQGRPSVAPRSLFFGNPDSSYSELQVTSADVGVEHRLSDRALVRSRTRFTRYNKFYQNVYPGSAVDASGSTVNLAAYNSHSDRSNLLNQNELVIRLPSERFAQTILAGIEFGRQATDNLRQSGYFNGTATSLVVPFDAPTVTTPVAFRPSASDPDNFVLARTVSVYAQDQLELTRNLELVLGARLERFDLHYRNNRAPQSLERRDNMISPRAGLVFKPDDVVSLYASVGISHLPGAGDQFSSLTPTTQTLEPERFTNQEVGVKWSVLPELSFNAAAYRLMRTKTAAPSALDPGVYVQTGRQRTIGYELSVSGQVARGWDAVGSFVSQRATIVSRTTAAPAGVTVPLVPRRTASLWSRVEVLPSLRLGVGAVYQGATYAAIDNSVRLPAFWRLDAAAFLPVANSLTLQLNVENLLNRSYYATSHGNNNIMPGAPRTIRISLATDLRPLVP